MKPKQNIVEGFVADTTQTIVLMLLDGTIDDFSPTEIVSEFLNHAGSGHIFEPLDDWHREALADCKLAFPDEWDESDMGGSFTDDDLGQRLRLEWCLIGVILDVFNNLSSQEFVGIEFGTLEDGRMTVGWDSDNPLKHGLSEYVWGLKCVKHGWVEVNGKQRFYPATFRPEHLNKVKKAVQKTFDLYRSMKAYQREHLSNSPRIAS